jgi:hypothetical protein
MRPANVLSFPLIALIAVAGTDHSQKLGTITDSTLNRQDPEQHRRR